MRDINRLQGSRQRPGDQQCKQENPPLAARSLCSSTAGDAELVRGNSIVSWARSHLIRLNGVVGATTLGYNIAFKDAPMRRFDSKERRTCDRMRPLYVRLLQYHFS